MVTRSVVSERMLLVNVIFKTPVRVLEESAETGPIQSSCQLFRPRAKLLPCKPCTDFAHEPLHNL